MKTRIDQVEPSFAHKLNQGIPVREALKQVNLSVPNDTYTIRVVFRDAKGRKKPSHAAAENWSAESSDRIEMWFEPVPQQPMMHGVDKSLPQHVPDTRTSPAAMPDGPVSDLVRALNRAESRPGWSFVPLKKFRDEMLATETFPWAASSAERRTVLQSAIDKKFVLVGHVQNPKPPHFPVSTVRLNRVLQEVQRIIGPGRDADLDFHPVEILGEPLSATILRERR